MHLSLGFVAASAFAVFVRGGSVHQPEGMICVIRASTWIIKVSRCSHESFLVRAHTPQRPPNWRFDGRGFTQISLPNNRSALVHISSAYDHAEAHPLILDFHGAGVGAAYQTLLDNVLNDTLRINRRDIVTMYGQGTTGTDGEVVWQGAPYSSGANDVSIMLFVYRMKNC
jgi:hypothetical protein